MGRPQDAKWLALNKHAHSGLRRPSPASHTALDHTPTPTPTPLSLPRPLHQWEQGFVIHLPVAEPPRKAAEKAHYLRFWWVLLL